MAKATKGRSKKVAESAAARAWATRRANGDPSAAARKAWETRRANAQPKKVRRSRKAA